MKNKIICIVMFNLCYFTVLGQIGQTVSGIFPPSPEASAFAKYAKIPINLSTGIPNINLPLLELEGRDMNIPISLSYHSAGNKVNEISSNVGLGWVLNAGGVITRVVRGRNDDHENGYIGTNHRGVKIKSTDFPLMTTVEKLLYGAGQYGWDSEPDIFYFNFLGNEGRFVFDPDGSIIMTPEQDFKIHAPFGPKSNNNYWTIIDKDGTIFKFDKKENNKSITTFGDTTYPTIEYISSWYLSSIESKKGEVFSFEYQTGNTVETNNILERYAYGFSEMGIHETITEISNLQTLSKITSSFGTIDILSISDRLDLSGAKRISDISLKNNNNKVIKKFVFNTDYFISSENCNDKECKRLKLSSIDEISPYLSSIKISKYSFEYNSTKLPRRDSPQIDHWGYYNANNQENLISRSDPYNINTIRTPKESSSKAHILEKIVYATGGSVSFNYELNAYKFSSSINLPSGGLRIISTEENYLENKNPIITNYKYVNEDTSISSGTQYSLPSYIDNDVEFYWDISILSQPCRRIEYWNGTFIYSTASNLLFDLNGSNISYNEVIVENADGSKEINKFTDFISNEDVFNSSDYFTCTLDNRSGNYTINEIDPHGAPYGPPSYHKTHQRGLLTEKIIKNGLGEPIYQLNNTYAEKNPNDFLSTIGYKFDKESVFTVYFDLSRWINRYDENENFLYSDYVCDFQYIKKIIKFNISKYYETNGVYQLTKSIEKTIDNGTFVELEHNYTYTTSKATLLKNKTVKLSNGDVNKEEYTYPFELSGTINNILTDKNVIENHIEKKDFLNDEQLFLEEHIFKYNIPGYINNGDVPLLQETKKTKKNSEEFSNLSIVKYDMFGNPLETSKEGGMHSIYVWGYNGQYPIAKIENATYNDLMIFKYQNGGNHLAPIYNASNSDDDRTIGNTGKEGVLRQQLQKLRDAFPKALITSYTYDPLIGVTSITDPRGETIYYEYDEFNRLQFVKDADGNILSKNEYNYKQ